MSTQNRDRVENHLGLRDKIEAAGEDKFAAKTITKGLFYQEKEEEEDDDEYFERIKKRRKRHTPSKQIHLTTENLNDKQQLFERREQLEDVQKKREELPKQYDVKPEKIVDESMGSMLKQVSERKEKKFNEEEYETCHNNTTINIKNLGSGEKQIEKIKLAGRQYFQFDKTISLKNQLLTSILPNYVFSMKFIRNPKYMWPQFDLNFSKENEFLMNAKKASTMGTSTFIITYKKGDFEETSAYYLGKMKSNFLGDVFNVFGPGLNSTNAEKIGETPRELLATIVYQIKILPTSAPRKFEVYVKKPEYGYYKDFGVKMYKEEIPLHTLYENQDNKAKIIRYQTKDSLSIQAGNEDILNIGKKDKKESIKNFILEKCEDGSKVMMFCKESEDRFQLNVLAPLSPYIAFAIALSNFSKRAIGQ